ncbi:restriction endonuclease subunit S [Streptomyces mutabilis]|uniref:restriction endonuclease subunit S n=1 Tax=Streptomyces mutabilis TaxID=67332 RepID=UPI0037B44877
MRDNRLPYGSTLPGTWAAVPLKYLATLTNGYVFNSGERSDTGTPIVRIENLNGSSRFYHSQLSLPNKYRVDSGDLLFSWSGNPGTSFGPYLWTKHGKHYLNQHIFKVGVFGCDPRWLYWALMAATHWIERELTSGMIGMVHVTKEDLSGVPIPVPPVGEQRRIADFLDAETARIDELRSLTQRQVALARERFIEEMRKLTTEGDGYGVETQVSWMPRVHREWSLSRVSYEFTTSSGTTPTSSRADYFDGPHPWVNSSDIKNAPIQYTSKHVSDAALAEFSALTICPAGSLVVALYGQGVTKGRVGILQMDACMNQACCALTSLGRVSEEFAAYWFRAHKEGIVTQAVGAGQPNLSQELIRQLRIPVPPAETQKKIVAQLSDAEEQLRAHVSLLQRRDALLAERRQALVTAAVTGQLDVSTASGRNATEGVSA